MRVPVPENRLVAFTLAGALLTAVVAGALAIPGGGLAAIGEQPDPAETAGPGGAGQAAADAPTANQEFTPAVRTQSGRGGGEYEEHEEAEEHEEEEDEHEEDDEYDEAEEGAEG